MEESKDFFARFFALSRCKHRTINEIKNGLADVPLRNTRSSRFCFCLIRLCQPKIEFFGISPQSFKNKAMLFLFPFEGKKCDKSCSLDCGREKSLMLRAYAGHTTRKDLAFLGYVFFQFSDVFIVDFGSFLQAKSANLSSRRFSHRLFGNCRCSGSRCGRCRYVCSLFFHDFNSF